MGQAKTVAMSLVAILVCFVLAVPVLTALFSRGGAFDQLQGTLEGSCAYTSSSTFTAAVPAEFSALPAGGITVPDGASPVSDGTNAYFRGASGQQYFVGTTAAALNCDASADGAATANNAGYTAAETALEDSVYQPILVAIFALIPLGLMLTVGWMFVGSRIGESKSGGRRRRRGGSY